MTERANNAENESEVPAAGRSIVDRIRSETNNEFAYFSGREGEDVFATLYLTERDRSIPDQLIGDDLLIDIRTLFYQVFDGLREELKERLGIRDSLWLAVDPSYEDSTFSVLCTDEQVLMLHWSKAWNFYWPREEAMVEYLGRLYDEAAKRLRPPAERQDAPGV